MPMPELTRTLSLVLGRTVIDKTGFSGLFDLAMTFLPDENTVSMPPPPPNVAAALESKTLTSILVASAGVNWCLKTRSVQAVPVRSLSSSITFERLFAGNDF